MPAARAYYKEIEYTEGWLKNHGFVCRGGIYAARCSSPDITIYRENCTERSRPFPTNLPEMDNFAYNCLPSGYL